MWAKTVAAIEAVELPVISLFFGKKFPASSNIFAVRQVMEFARQPIVSEPAPTGDWVAKTDGWKNSLLSRIRVSRNR
jgi:hypothetical protein